jgi:hypothetical protein
MLTLLRRVILVLPGRNTAAIICSREIGKRDYSAVGFIYPPAGRI